MKKLSLLIMLLLVVAGSAKATYDQKEWKLCYEVLHALFTNADALSSEALLDKFVACAANKSDFVANENYLSRIPYYGSMPNAVRIFKKALEKDANFPVAKIMEYAVDRHKGTNLITRCHEGATTLYNVENATGDMNKRCEETYNFLQVVALEQKIKEESNKTSRQR